MARSRPSGLKRLLLLLALMLLLCCAFCQARGVQRNVPHLRATKKPSELLRKYGYPSEVHTVLTDDGYLLRVDRIPRPGAPVILMGHALLTSAAIFLVNGRKSLGFALYDAGYDVWLVNFRGNGFSVNHVRLTTKDPEFWLYSFHEHGVLDIPAVIDYVLDSTAQPSLLYVGFSMGSTSLLITLSERPEYNVKVRAAYLMAPVAILKHHNFPLISYFAKTANSSWADAVRTGVQRFQYLGPEIQGLVGATCLGSSKSPLNICNYVAQAFNVIGKNFTDDVIPTIPTSMSIGEGVHYGQLADPKWPGFRKRNFGKNVNIQLYGQEVPPDYALWRIKAPLFLYVGKTDATTHPKDVAALVSRVSSIQKVVRVPKDPFDHVDFALNKEAPDVYKTILDDMKEFTSIHK